MDHTAHGLGCPTDPLTLSGGLFAPRWRPDARGVCVGLTQFSTGAHIARALLEAICFQTRDVLEAMLQDVAEVGAGVGGMARLSARLSLAWILLGWLGFRWVQLR